MEHSRLTIWSLFFLVASCGSVFAQRKPVLPPPVDSLITVGYATGSMKTISGSVEKITETQMNKDQITNPLEAIRGRVPGLTIQRGTNGPAALDAVRLRGTTSLTSGNDPLIIVDGVIRRFEYACFHLPYGYREFYHPQGCFRNITVRIAGGLRCHRNHYEERNER